MKFVMGMLLMASLSGLTKENQFEKEVKRVKALTWEQRIADYEVDFEGHIMWMGTKQLTVFDLCMADENTMRTKKTYKKEVLDSHDGFETIGEDYLYRKLVSTKTIVDYDDTTEIEVINTRNVDIDVVQFDEENEGELLFTEQYVIPNC